MTDKLEEWFYMDQGKKVGPVILPVLQSRYVNGYLDGSTEIWTERYGTVWKRFDSAEDVSHIYNRPEEPNADLTNLWLYALSVVPIIAVVVNWNEVHYGIVHVDNSILSKTIVAFALSLGLCFADLDVLRKNGYKSLAQELKRTSLWFFPLYVVQRSFRTDKLLRPSVIWMMSVVVAVFLYQPPQVIATKKAIPPACDYPKALTLVEKTFLQLNPEFTGLRVEWMSPPVEEPFPTTKSIRKCKITIRDNIKNISRAVYTVGVSNDQLHLRMFLTDPPN